MLEIKLVLEKTIQGDIMPLKPVRKKSYKCELCDKEAIMKLVFPHYFSFGGYRHRWGSYKYVCDEHERAYDVNDPKIKREFYRETSK